MKTYHLCFAGVTIRISCEGEGPERILDTLFRDVLSSERDSPHVTYCLIQEGNRGEVRLYRRNDLERRARSEVEMSAYLLDRVVYHLADHSRTGLVFHAAALAWKGHGLLLPGPTGSGKTTLTAWLLARGFDYLTDELAFIPLDTTELQGLARPLNVKKRSKGVLEALLGPDAIEKETVTDGTKIIAPSRAFGSSDVLHSVPLRHIIFPRFSTEGRYEPHGYSKGKHAKELMGCLINARNLPDHGLSEVARLARAIPAYGIEYGSIDRAVEFIINTMQAIE